MEKILTDIVSVLKTAQDKGGLPEVKVNTSISLDNQTIVKIAAGLFVVGALTVGGLLFGLNVIFKDK